MNRLILCAFYLICFASFFISANCKNDSPVTAKPPKDPSTYSWTIDTLSYEGSTQTLLDNIWGTSPQDVYASGFNERGWGELYHYDGKVWSVVIHGHKKIDVGQVFGFAPNNIFLVGGYIYLNPSPPPNFLDSSVILHYDGQQWNEMEFSRTEELYAIWGISSDYLIAAGKHGALIQYDGLAWNKLNTDKRFYLSRITGNKTKIYAFAYVPDPETPDNIGKAYVLAWKDSNFIIRDSMTTLAEWYNPKFGDSGIQLINDKLFSVGSGVFLMEENNQWQKILDVHPNTLLGIYGTNENNIFVCGSNKTLFHFNGTDWKQLEIPGDSSLWLYGIWCNDNEVFVIGEDGNKSYVIHGK